MTLACPQSTERRRCTISAVERRRPFSPSSGWPRSDSILLEPVGHRPGRQVEASCRRGHVLAGVEVGLERLDELLAEPLVGEHRAELAPHGGVREVPVREQQTLEGQLLGVRDPAAQAEPLGGARGVDEIGIRRGERTDAVDRP